MAVAQRMTEQEYQEFALGDPDGPWELWDGVPREKPTMSMMHGGTVSFLGSMLTFQVDPADYRVHINHARSRVSALNYYIPDVAVIPTAFVAPYEDDPRSLDAYADPLPLVVEVWSPSTGRYDVDVKLRGYQERGDREIWYLHPYDRTLTARRRQPDGSYREAVYRGGTVEPVSLPGVAIDLDVLFDRRRPAR